MIISPDAAVRLTRSELNTLRTAAARNGVAVNGIRDTGELLQAGLDGLSPQVQADLLEFLETGSSPRTRGETPAPQGPFLTPGNLAR